MVPERVHSSLCGGRALKGLLCESVDLSIVVARASSATMPRGRRGLDTCEESFAATMPASSQDSRAVLA